MCVVMRIRFVLCTLVMFFFFKQKTAYEMRISDWNSDVCSSDLEALTGDLQDQLIEGRLDMALLFQTRKEEDPLTNPSESAYLVKALRNEPPLGAPLSLADLTGIPLTMPSTRHQIRQFLADLPGRQGIPLDICSDLDGHELGRAHS